MQNITIVVAEDMVLLRRLLVQRLAKTPGFRIVGEAANGKEALDLAASQRPDVIVMDVKMPVMDGITATDRIRRLDRPPAVILISSYEDLTGLGRLVGATRVLTKNHTMAQLINAIRDVVDLKSIPGTLSRSAEDPITGALDHFGVRMGLTEREILVLQKVVGSGMTVAQIAEQLSLDINETVTRAAIKHTMERIFTKLEIAPRTQANLVKSVLSQIRQIQQS
jgi:DNA-binding NarL/FixJ family response regulator